MGKGKAKLWDQHRRWDAFRGGENLELREKRKDNVPSMNRRG